LLRRTACYGSCPQYSVGVRGDGTVHFYGAGYTQTLGYATARIGRGAVAALLKTLRTHEFLSLADRYPAHRTDHSSAVTILEQGDAAKVVEHNLSNDDAPAIAKIEEAIDHAAGTARWIGDTSRKPFNPGVPPPLADEDLKRLTETSLAGIAAQCKSPRLDRLSVILSIDDFGRARVTSWSAHGHDLDAIECVKREFARLRFPISDVSRAGQLVVFGR